jgi:predicted restriction endonuclease
VAHYGGSWQELEGCLAGEQLEALCRKKSKQQSIRELWPEPALQAVESRGVRLPPQAPTSTGPTRPEELPGGRRRREAAARNGQDGFRRALIRAYGLICAVTGPAPAEVLHAAHLRPFAEHERHRVDEGLMLRSDVHSLLDKHLLAVSPALEIHVSPHLRGHRLYWDLHGSALRIPRDAPLNRAVLREIYDEVTATW